MDADKKRKVDDNETQDLNEILKTYIESSRDMAKMIAFLFEKIVCFESILNSNNKD
jgi:hypothetical protein